MITNSLRWSGVAALFCGLVFTGIGVARQDSVKVKPAATPGPVRSDATPHVTEVQAPSAKQNDELSRNNPTGRFGAESELDRARNDLLKAARHEWDRSFEEFANSNLGVANAYWHRNA